MPIIHGFPSSHAGAPVLAGKGLTRSFRSGDTDIAVIRGVDIELYAGQVTVLMGPSGSGKSTLLHVLAGLDTPTTGAVEFEGRALHDRSEGELADWRARYVGFVLQRNNLVPTLTVEENVAAPLLIAGTRRGKALARARTLLTAVNLQERAGAWPASLSGGEAARAAVARACVAQPRIIFADEPTGSLDRNSGQTVLALFNERVRQAGAAALVVTHDPEVAAAADRVHHICDGVLTDVA
jgi:ABC-type lipoprotein export system ATPase subunit